MTKHTPGPWMVEPIETSGNYDIRQRPAFRPALVWDTGMADETLANAQLVAAAPELLAALVEIEKAEGVYSSDRLAHANNTIESAQQIARAAIALATGGAS